MSENSDEENKKSIDELILKTDKIKILKHNDFLGNSMLGLLPSADTPISVFFLTVALPVKEKWRLNKTTNFRWGDYKPSEQYLIIKRYEHFLLREAEGYEMYFEYTKEVNLHLHCIVWYKGIEKELRVDTKRFFGINPQNSCAVDCRPAYDLDYLRTYLTEKQVKDYQTSPFPPIIKKPIEDFN